MKKKVKKSSNMVPRDIKIFLSMENKGLLSTGKLFSKLEKRLTIFKSYNLFYYYYVQHETAGSSFTLFKAAVIFVFNLKEISFFFFQINIRDLFCTTERKVFSLKMRNLFSGLGWSVFYYYCFRLLLMLGKMFWFKRKKLC